MDGQVLMPDTTSRKHFIDRFKNLQKNSRFKAIAIVLAYFFMILAAIYLGQNLVHQDGLAANVGVVLLIIFMATRMRGLNNIVHECTHRSFTAKREDNLVLGRLAAALVFNSFDAYQKEHISHHINRGNYEKDLDFKHRRVFHIEQRLSKSIIAKHILTPIFGLHLPKYFKVDLSRTDGNTFFALKLLMITGFLFFAYQDLTAALILVLIPYAWIYTAINYWTDCIDHGGILTNEEEIEASRNFIVPRGVRYLLFPRNNCFHLLHHLFPSIPSQHFDTCHNILMTDRPYRDVN